MGLEEDKAAHLTTRQVSNLFSAPKPLSRALIAHRTLHVFNQQGTQMLSDISNVRTCLSSLVIIQRMSYKPLPCPCAGPASARGSHSISHAIARYPDPVPCACALHRMLPLSRNVELSGTTRPDKGHQHHNNFWNAEISIRLSRVPCISD